MKLPLLQIVVTAFLPLVLRTMLYLLACRLRSVHITVMSAVIIACAGSFLLLVPIPLPFFLRQPVVIGIAMILFGRYTDAELLPDVLFIPLVIELLSGILLQEVLFPLLA